MFFWHGKVYLFWKFIQYTIHWDKTQIFKKNLSDKTDLTKIYSFLFRELQHITLLLLIRNSYTSWSTMFISLEVSWDFPFSIPFVFIKLYFFSTKSMGSCLWNVIIPFKIKITETPHTALLPYLWFLSSNKKFQNSIISAWVGALEKLTWRRIF